MASVRASADGVPPRPPAATGSQASSASASSAWKPGRAGSMRCVAIA